MMIGYDSHIFVTFGGIKPEYFFYSILQRYVEITWNLTVCLMYAKKAAHRCNAKHLILKATINVQTDEHYKT